MGAYSDVARDFVEVELHHVGVSVGQGEGRADAPRRTDRPKQIGVVVALIGRLRGPRSASGPLPDETVLLADPGATSHDFCGKEPLPIARTSNRWPIAGAGRSRAASLFARQC